MNGSKYATAFFITRALFTTCGKNILPAPNKSPTTCMPLISGPSIISSAAEYFCRASSTSDFNKIDDAFHERVRKALFDRFVAPRQIGNGRLGASLLFDCLSKFN